ncbi:probable glycosyl transferase [Leucobacter sp. 7(1)]|nr:probable glycosyl transferase [Leucobacter sp. 7(1)]
MREIGGAAGCLPSEPENAPLVSVIIPVYNAAEFLHRCIDSVLAQTMPDFELIAINDGSTDTSLEILEQYAASDPRVRVTDQENAGQGSARNRALGLATGRYVLFVDADDFIERVTLQVTTERAEEDQSDLVHFDWKLYSPGTGHPGGMHYYNADPFWHKRVLLGAGCDELLRVQNFYSVTNLYRRGFLATHGIVFEEGRIYEDNPFVLQAVNRAEIASLVHSPLYTINPHPESTTRSNTDTDKHVRDHLHAVARTFELLNRRNPRAAAYLAAYHVKKIGPYYERRIPRRYRRAYIREFVEILHAAQIEIPPATSTNAPMRLAMRLRLFEERRYTAFQAMISGKNAIMPRVKRGKAWLRRQKHRRSKAGAWSAQLERVLAGPVKSDAITFLGLDFKYTGNSRYLFEQLLADERFAGLDLKFVTTDTRVPEHYRLPPSNAGTNAHLARSRVVIAESWIPPHVRKHRDSTWVQLWHGTPIKRMLFDSHEPRIIWNRRHHKTSKYRDIQQWDYFVVDSEIAAQKFQTAFLLDPAKIVRTGYPRVAYLRDHANDRPLQQRIRSELGIAPKQKIVLYAPTWRDYNYGRSLEEGDFSYVLDLQELTSELGDEYAVVFHDHGYLSSELGTNRGTAIDASDMETQELLLIADVLVTDYSSVAFDAQAIGLPVVWHIADAEMFEESRGVYKDVASAGRVGATGSSEMLWDLVQAATGEPRCARELTEVIAHQSLELIILGSIANSRIDAVFDAGT